MICPLAITDLSPLYIEKTIMNIVYIHIHTHTLAHAYIIYVYKTSNVLFDFRLVKRNFFGLCFYLICYNALWGAYPVIWLLQCTDIYVMTLSVED